MSKQTLEQGELVDALYEIRGADARSSGRYYPREVGAGA